MCSCPRSMQSIAQAHGLMTTVQWLVSAVADGGQVSALHLTAVGEEVLALLQELGGFDEVLLGAPEATISAPRNARAIWLAEEILAWLYVLAGGADERCRSQLIEVRDNVLCLLDELGGFEAIGGSLRRWDGVDASPRRRAQEETP